MSRYIDADKIEYKHIVVFPDREDEHSVYKSEIDAIPTADVVEVVRCKDCINFNKYEDCDVPNAFCSDGERRKVSNEQFS